MIHELGRGSQCSPVESVTKSTLRGITRPESSPVMHLPLVFNGSLTRTAKLYLNGRVHLVNPNDVALRSLYTMRCPGSIVYPVMRVEDAGQGTGALNIAIVLNGRAVDLNELIAAAQQQE